jgi:hypothetical protein
METQQFHKTLGAAREIIR